MRPLLHPSLCLTWRDQTTLQIGATPDVAAVLGGLGAVERRLIAALDGHHDRSALRALAVEIGGGAAAADRVVDVLLATGAVVDADLTEPVGPAHLVPDQRSAGLQARSPDGGRSAMLARRRRAVEVTGAGRVGAGIARLLAAAGVGTVVVHDPDLAEPADVCPAGLTGQTVGRRRGPALTELIRADTPATERPSAPVPDFIVIATPTGRDEAAEATRLGIAHLVVQVLETTGSVGPLVIPGTTSCLRCHDLHRTERDRHWPLVLDELNRRPPTEPAQDVTLCTTVAGLGASHVLAFLDGVTPATVDGTIDITTPYGLPRRRSWIMHPDCDCTDHPVPVWPPAR